MSNNFQLFDQLVPEYLKHNNPKKKNMEEKSCLHSSIINEKNGWVCTDCGEEISQEDISMDQEWRYYGVSDTKHNSDPNRCQPRKIEERSIFKDVEGMGFNDKIISIANRIYFEVSKGNIFRGNKRRSIIFACVFHALKLENCALSCDILIKKFSLDRRDGLNGLKYVNQHAPKDSPIRGTYITPVHLIEETMNKFDATNKQKQEVIDIYNKVQHRSPTLNRSRPQSISASIIWFYILKTGKNISMKDYKKMVNLSELTINKISKEIESILKRIEEKT